MKPTILLLSGTSEGRELAAALLDTGFHVIATVTQETASERLFGPLRSRLRVLIGGFTESALYDFLDSGQADIVVDATHPFAARITCIAQRVCQRLRVPLVRFERPAWTPPDDVQLVDDFVEAARLLPELSERAMLTIGARQLKHFSGLHKKVTMFARILPSPLSLAQAIQAGFPLQNICCLQPPFSRDFNLAMFQHYRVDTVVAKESGQEGGTPAKVEAALKLGINAVVIRRPAITVENTQSTIGGVVAACLACKNATTSLP
ncbi:MAG: precorrin-6A reductase [Gemmatales bacterium]|nr:MAG: precorrin-6A reductase [Gemmatales bacterium]